MADVELILPAAPENVAVARHVMTGVGEALGFSVQELADLRLAVSEACTNVVMHAYGEGQPGTVEISATVEERLLHVVVRDEGGGVAARPDSPGLGLGLPLISAVTDRLEIGGDGGGEVRMAFIVPSATP